MNHTTQNTVIIIVSIILGLLFDYFFYEKALGVAFLLFTTLILAGLFFLAQIHKKPINSKIIILIIPLLFFSSMIFIRASYLLTFFNIVAVLFLLYLVAESALGKKIHEFLFSHYFMFFIYPINLIVPYFKTLNNLVFAKKTEKNKNSAAVIRGIAIALPFLVVFLILFSSADIIFQKFLLDIIHIEIKPEYILRTILIILVASFFTGAYAYVMSAKYIPNLPKQKFSGAFGNIETSILLGSISALFLIFIAFQFTYLFAGESAIVSQGFTYSQYARRGFFELIFAAIITFVLLYTVEKYIQKKEKGHSFGFKMASLILALEVVLIMVSAYTRLALYEDAYGFTTSRLFAHGIILWIAVAFFILLYKIFIDARENIFAFSLFASLVLFLAGFNILNPDAFIARQNIERYEKSKQLDVYYLSWLSDDAIPETIKILNVEDEDLRNTFSREIYWQFKNKYASEYDQWQSFHLSRERARRIISSQISKLEKYKDYQPKIEPPFSPFD